MPSPRRYCCNMRCARRTSRGGVLALALVVGVAACGTDPRGPMGRVNVPAGASFHTAAESLAAAGYIASPTLFSVYAKVTRKDRGIKAGSYVLEHGMSWSQLVDALRAGEGLERRVTIPEGWSLAEIVPVLARALGTPPESVEAAVRDTALLRQLQVPTSTLEGYLFHDTYLFAYGTSPRAAVREMVRRFEAVWESPWPQLATNETLDDRLQELAISRNDVITLASIVEKEARVPEERPVIAAVYLNRLRRQMPLQADPTVQYALGVHRDRVYYKDLEVDSPYNTYRYRGLPPGPIASPGRASLEAALFPANVPYLFFVAHPDGHHEFRTTFRGHLEARQEVRRAREEHGR